MASRVVTMNPNDRFALVGKSGSGKTSHGVVLAARLVPPDIQHANGWECWWVDSKNDPKDIDRLHRWGFQDGYKAKSPRKLIVVPFEKGKPQDTVERVNDICYKALDTHGVVVVIDEYRHVVPTTRTASPGLLHIHQRGRGLDVGLIGMTQEPCEIPRQLISQANHIMLFNVTYPHDIKYCRTINPGYRPPSTQGHKYGFYHGWVDGDGIFDYYPHQQAWSARFNQTADV